VLRFNRAIGRRLRTAFDCGWLAVQRGVLLDVDMTGMSDPVDSWKQYNRADDHDRPVHIANIRQIDGKVHWEAAACVS
jgi:hypothetical protein